MTKKKAKEDHLPVGRPTIMTPDTVSKLDDAFLAGCSDIQACLYADISKQTLYDYQKIHPEYVDRKEALKDNVKMHAKLNISKKVITEADIETSKYVLDRTDPDFKPKNKLEIEGVLSQEEMDAQAKLTAKYLDDINKGE